MQVRDLHVSDAPGLSRLFTRCYGDTYGTRLFYDVPALAYAIEHGRLRSVVVIEKQLVGHTGISIVHEGSLVCETGNTVVDPEMRGRGLLEVLRGALSDRVRREGFAGYVHYPTTAHEIMQRHSVANGGVETGLMLAYVPDTTDYKGVQTRSGRIAATVAYQPLSSTPHRAVHVPERYRNILDQMYTHIGYERTAADAPVVWDESTHIQLISKPARGLLQLLVSAAASGAIDELKQHLHANTDDISVIHVDLPLDSSWVHEVVEQLVANHGFMFCALLPEFQRCDLLRLQCIRVPGEAVFEPDIVNPGAQTLLALIRKDQQ